MNNTYTFYSHKNPKMRKVFAIIFLICVIGVNCQQNTKGQIASGQENYSKKAQSLSQAPTVPQTNDAHIVEAKSNNATVVPKTTENQEASYSDDDEDKDSFFDNSSSESSSFDNSFIEFNLGSENGEEFFGFAPVRRNFRGDFRRGY